MATTPDLLAALTGAISIGDRSIEAPSMDSGVTVPGVNSLEPAAYQEPVPASLRARAASAPDPAPLPPVQVAS